MWNKIKTVLAAALIVAGIATFAYQGIRYATRERDGRDTALPSVERAGGIPLAPILGAISLVAGIALLLMDTQDFKRAATPKRARKPRRASMRIHNTGPRTETDYPRKRKVSWGHDYGTRGGEALERPFIDDGPTHGHGAEDPSIEGFFYRVWSRVRSIVRPVG